MAVNTDYASPALSLLEMAKTFNELDGLILQFGKTDAGKAMISGGLVA